MVCRFSEGVECISNVEHRLTLLLMTHHFKESVRSNVLANFLTASQTNLRFVIRAWEWGYGKVWFHSAMVFADLSSTSVGEAVL